MTLVPLLVAGVVAELVGIYLPWQGLTDITD